MTSSRRFAETSNISWTARSLGLCWSVQCLELMMTMSSGLHPWVGSGAWLLLLNNDAVRPSGRERKERSMRAVIVRETARRRW